jgi:hypothetical protein
MSKRATKDRSSAPATQTSPLNWSEVSQYVAQKFANDYYRAMREPEAPFPRRDIRKEALRAVAMLATLQMNGAQDGHSKHAQALLEILGIHEQTPGWTQYADGTRVYADGTVVPPTQADADGFTVGSSGADEHGTIFQSYNPNEPWPPKETDGAKSIHDGLVQMACERLGRPSRHRVYRDENIDLDFDGWLIGKHGTEAVSAAVYLTIPNLKIVTSVVHKRGGANKRKAAAHDRGDKALAWFKHDHGGRLGEASKQAWTSACRAWSSLQDMDVERVG